MILKHFLEPLKNSRQQFNSSRARQSGSGASNSRWQPLGWSMGKGKEKLGKRAHVKDARQEKANERQERARLRKDRQRNGYYCSDADDKEFEAQASHRQTCCDGLSRAADLSCCGGTTTHAMPCNTSIMPDSRQNPLVLILGGLSGANSPRDSSKSVPKRSRLCSPRTLVAPVVCDHGPRRLWFRAFFMKLE